MGSGTFDFNKPKAPEQKQGRKFGGLKLPRLVPKMKLKTAITVGAGLAVLGAYTLGNTYSVGQDEAVYSINTIRSAAARVQVYQGSGFRIPILSAITQENYHFPWPLGGSDAPGGWPIGAHAVVQLSDRFHGTVENAMYRQEIIDLSYTVDDRDVEAHVLEFGRYAMATTMLDRAREADEFNLTSIVEAAREGGEEVDGATEALLDRIYEVISYVQSGKSVEEMNAMKNNPAFVAYLIHEIETLIPTIHIDTLVLGNVTRQPNVITVTTADGVPVDLQILYGNTRGGWSTALDKDDEQLVRDVFANHYLMELGSAGELPDQIHRELCLALGVEEDTLTSLAQYERLERLGTGGTMSGYSTSNRSRTLVVNLGNAQDQFYRKSFDSGLLAFSVSVADERMAEGDTEGAIEMLLGIVEHAHMHPLSPEAQAYVADSMLDLGWLYEGLAQTAYVRGDYETSQEHAQNAGMYFWYFLQYAPSAHPERDDIGNHLHAKYGDMFDWTTLRPRQGAELDLDKYSTGTSAPAPVEEETPAEAEGEGEGE